MSGAGHGFLLSWSWLIRHQALWGTLVHMPWQNNAEGGSVCSLGLVLQGPSMSLNDSGGYGEPQAGPILFSTKERVEQSPLGFGGIPLPVSLTSRMTASV